MNTYVGTHQIEPKLSYLPSIYGWVAIAVSFIAASFMASSWFNLRIRTVAVTFFGIIAAVLTIGDGHAGTYASIAAGIALVAGGITLFRGLARKADVEPLAFQLMMIITIAVSGFVVALIVSAWSQWSIIVDIFAIDRSILPYSNIAAVGNWIPANTNALLAFALYYFLGIGLMILEIMQLNSKQKQS